VLMINDQSSGVGAMTEKSRLQGVVRGTPNGELILDRVMSDESVAPGEILLSSGGDRIFPKGLPVGRVSKVNPGREMFLNIQVKPAADLSRVEEVLVVTEKQERQPVAESGATVRAADILAQRLPSVPEKPAAVAGTAATGAVPGGATVHGPGIVAKPQGNSAAKAPAVAGTAGTLPKTTNGAAPPAGSNVAGASSTNGVSIVEQPAVEPPRTSGDALKVVVQKEGSGDSAPRGSTAKARADSAVSTTPSAAANSTSKPANPSAKPSSAQPKGTGPAANPPPPATEDNPH